MNSPSPHHNNPVNSRYTQLAQLVIVVFACWLFPTSVFATPAFVQRNSATPQSSTAMVTVSYSAAETAGNLNVVVVGWNDTTATVQPVKDSVGNPYSLAIGPNSGTALRQSIYYASNILGGSNTVTVTYTQAAAFPDGRLLGHTGVIAVDVTSGASGNSATSNSGAAQTKVASELIFGANTVATATGAAGSGFSSRVIPSPDGHIAEDKVVTATGSDSATATLTSGGPWVMQMVPAPSRRRPAPTVTSVSPNSGTTAGGTAVTITGTNFAAGATVMFGSTAASSVVVVNATTITATTPAGTAGAVMVTVTVNGQSGSLANGFTYSGTAAISFVQAAVATPQSSMVTVPVAYAGAQTAGDLNVVVVGWNDTTATVQSVKDSAGNAYSLAIGPTSGTALRQSIYYAPNIVAGSNTVTVTFSQAAASPDVRILEYRGVNAVDVTAGASGNSTAANSGAATTTVANELVFGADIVATITGAAGSGFTSRVITSPDGDIAEDRVVTTAGSNSATATLTSGGPWVMQLVTFAAVSGLAPTVTSVSPNSGTTAGGTAVTITGTNFAAGATVMFGSTAASNAAVVSGTQITATTPAGGAGAVMVTVSNPGGQSGGLASAFTYVAPPTVTSVSPSNGPAAGGTGVTITGTNFAAGATVMFGSTAASSVVVVNATTITATTPAGTAGAVMVTVTVNGQSGSLANGFTYSGTAAISFVQAAVATPQSSMVTVPVAYAGAQTAGDLNVVVVGWNDTTATVQSVKDSAGNAYSLAIGPTSGTALRQSIYYAPNIVAGSNTVTVTFSQAAASPDVRILEYRGVNAVDVTAGASGNSTAANSGAATTTVANELVFGADIVATITGAAGSGFTSRVITSPDGDIAEDRVVTTAGSNSATATLTSGGPWVMQLVAFLTPSGINTPVVNLSTSSLNFGSVTTGNSSSPLPVTLSNVGSAPLTISSIAISGADNADFTQTNNCGSVVAPNGTCTINVKFTPTTTGQRASSVAISDNVAGSPQTITLSGTGTGFGVTPHTSVLTFNMTQQFTASGSVTWSVDGVVGGSSTSGTITTAGLYSPPHSVGSHTVSATTSQNQASATVYISNYPGTYTFHNDNLRTGQNNDETVLTPANVNPVQFGKLFSYSIDGYAFASPLYVAGVNIPSSGLHNVVYVATENDSVYAFDADGLSATPLWHVGFLKSGVTTVPCADVGECGDIPIQIGITSTPVLDPTSGTIYVVAKTKEGTNYVQRLHALDITTGAEKFGGPVVLAASVSGTGVDSTGGKEVFNSLRENQRTGLLLSNGMIYFAFGSHGDQSPWHGWVLGYNATTLQQVLAYNDTPNGGFGGGGIWQSGGGLATDSTGDLYFTTGNGDFDVNTGGVDYGDSIVKLSTSGSVVDYFTPYDQSNLSANDLDFGSAGPVLLVDQANGPYPHLLISAGKSGTIYVIDRDNMGHYDPLNDSQVVQVLVGALPNGNLEIGNFSAPVYYNGYVYFAAVNDSLRAFQLTNGLLSTTPTSLSAAVYPIRGGSMAVSDNNNTTAILWAIQNNGTTTPGALFAYDANNLTDELYDSNESGSRDTLDFAAKFSIPLVANGKVFVSSQSQLTAYGLLP